MTSQEVVDYINERINETPDDKLSSICEEVRERFCFKSSVADPGCLSQIRIFSIPAPHQSILTKKLFPSSRNMTGLFIPDPDFYPSRIPDPGVKMAPDPGSGTATLFQSS